MVMYMFNDKIRYLRKHQELTQAEVADGIDILQSTYSNYEQGTREPDFATLKKLANFFDVSIDYLLENDRSLSDGDETVDLNTFLLNGRYTIDSKFPTARQRRMLSNVTKEIFDAINEK